MGKSKKKRNTFSSSDKMEAVSAVRSGATVGDVCASKKINDRNLRRWLAEDKAWAGAGKSGPAQFDKRRGPGPILPPEAEVSIREWVVGQQFVGAPIARKDIIRKGCQISNLVCGSSVGDGWYRRFMERHPDLSARVSQSVSKVRNMVTDSDVSTLFGSLAKVIIENNMDGSRIFNIDETAFQSSRKTTRVIALKGSKNVWHTDATTSFHLSFVACGSASGFIVPPLFILPGERVDNEVLEGCSIPGAAVTTTDKAFMTATLFAKWIAFFANAIPTPVKRPLLLVMDGCSSHISTGILDTAERLQIHLVCLPANGTHLLQPLDVAVFSSFKNTLQDLITALVRGNGDNSVSKAKALQIATLAWTSCNFDVNISSGFRSCGIFPLSKVKMSEKLSNFQRNGAPVAAEKASWLRYKETVQQELLLLPARQTDKKKRRKTKTVAGRLLTREMLEQPDKPSSPKPRKTAKRSRRRRNSEAKEAQPSESDDPVLYVAIV